MDKSYLKLLLLFQIFQGMITSVLSDGLSNFCWCCTHEDTPIGKNVCYAGKSYYIKTLACGDKNDYCFNLFGLKDCKISVMRGCATTKFCEEDLKGLDSDDCNNGILQNGKSCYQCCQGNLCNRDMSRFNFAKTCSVINGSCISWNNTSGDKGIMSVYHRCDLCNGTIIDRITTKPCIVPCPNTTTTQKEAITSAKAAKRRTIILPTTITTLSTLTTTSAATIITIAAATSTTLLRKTTSDVISEKDCIDKQVNCTSLMHVCKNPLFTHSMKTVCAATCGFCNNSTTEPIMTTTTTPDLTPSTATSAPTTAAKQDAFSCYSYDGDGDHQKLVECADDKMFCEIRFATNAITVTGKSCVTRKACQQKWCNGAYSICCNASGCNKQDIPPYETWFYGESCL